MPNSNRLRKSLSTAREGSRNRIDFAGRAAGARRAREQPEHGRLVAGVAGFLRAVRQAVRRAQRTREAVVRGQVDRGQPADVQCRRCPPCHRCVGVERARDTPRERPTRGAAASSVGERLPTEVGEVRGCHAEPGFNSYCTRAGGRLTADLCALLPERDALGRSEGESGPCWGPSAERGQASQRGSVKAVERQDSCLSAGRAWDGPELGRGDARTSLGRSRTRSREANDSFGAQFAPAGRQEPGPSTE